MFRQKWRECEAAAPTECEPAAECELTAECDNEQLTAEKQQLLIGEKTQLISEKEQLTESLAACTPNAEVASDYTANTKLPVLTDHTKGGAKAACDACADVVCASWASPSTAEELRWLILVLPKEQVGCCVDTSELTDFSSLGYTLTDGKDPFGDPFCDPHDDPDRATTSFIPFHLLGTVPHDAFGTTDTICWDTATATTFKSMVRATEFKRALGG